MPYLRENFRKMILFGILIAALAFLSLVVFKKNYKASTDYLIVGNQTGSQDHYTLIKSAEYLGKVLSESIQSELFINEAIKTGKLNDEFLPFDAREKLKEWKKTVKINRVPELGIFTVEVLNNRLADVANISQAIRDVLINNNKVFLGDAQTVEIKILSGPIIERNPSINEIVLAIGAGFIFGILISAVWIYFLGAEFLPMKTDNNQSREKEYEESLEYLLRQ